MDLLMIPECMAIIISFLDKNSTKSLVVASGKKNQDIIKESLGRIRLPHFQICEWTFRNKIKSVHSYVLEENIKYVPDICKKLIILKNKYNRGVSKFISILNNNIEYLHVDCCQIKEIKSKTLKILFLLYNKNLDINILENIILSCPNLNKIFIYSKTLKLDNEWIDEIKNYNKNLIIKSYLSTHYM